MDIRQVPIKEIKPYAKNAKKHDATQIENVRKSIEKFGIVQPLVIDKDKTLVIGHCRLEACKRLGYKELPCVQVDKLTDEEVAMLRLLDNKLNESEWDVDLLAEELENLDFGEFDLDWGIELPDLEKDVEEDNYEEPEQLETKVKRGDIWQLGEHRLMCGDSTKEEDVKVLMDDKLADLLFTDPPYNVNIEQKKKKKILHCNEYNAIMNDDLPIDEFKEFLKNIFVNANKVIKNDASYYVFSCQGGDNEMMMMMMMREAGIKCRHQIIWVKDAPVFSMGRLDYDYKHEPILYGWKEKHNFYRRGEQDKSVWEFKRTSNKLHPTMKPVELVANALLNSTKNGDLVLDLFGGSGSTLIASEQLKRKCYTMELDEHYCDVIIDRWEKFTGKKAIKIGETK